jgi:hypothetical protein
VEAAGGAAGGTAGGVIAACGVTAAGGAAGVVAGVTAGGGVTGTSGGVVTGTSGEVFTGSSGGGEAGEAVKAGEAVEAGTRASGISVSSLFFIVKMFICMGILHEYFYGPNQFFMDRTYFYFFMRSNIQLELNQKV